jgi:3-hydroxyisobutyrate dehydrogenase-like beta-hydroxyacid dehydrogenase
MKIKSIGLLHPGAMGSSIGAAVMAGGREVYWLPIGRSAATAARAEEAGFCGSGDLSELVDTCQLIISVCPPAFAVEVADAVCSRRFTGLYLDANAVSPGTSRRIAAKVQDSGASFVDGGLVGPPAWQSGTTRMYLSGPLAAAVARIFAGSALQAVVLEGPAGRASALKMTYAAYTKGTTALLGAILAVAEREGVRETLAQEWSLSLPELAGQAVNRVRKSTAKAWRFEEEMRQIAATFSAAGLPQGFHEAAALVFGRQAHFKDNPEPPPVEEVLQALMESRERPGTPG